MTWRLNDTYYRASDSKLPVSVVAGTAVYAQVDSIRAGIIYGRVLESHERSNSNYNNILQGIAK